MNELYKDYGLTEDQYLDLIKPYQVLIHEIYKQQNAVVSIDLNVLKDFDTEEFIKTFQKQGIFVVQPSICEDFIDLLRKDTELYRAYKDNIAMAFKDEHRRQTEGLDSEEIGYKQDIHEIANQAAKNFLDLLIK